MDTWRSWPSAKEYCKLLRSKSVSPWVPPVVMVFKLFPDEISWVLLLRSMTWPIRTRLFLWWRKTSARISTAPFRKASTEPSSPSIVAFCACTIPPITSANTHPLKWKNSNSETLYSISYHIMFLPVPSFHWRRFYGLGWGKFTARIGRRSAVQWVEVRLQLKTDVVSCEIRATLVPFIYSHEHYTVVTFHLSIVLIVACLCRKMASWRREETCWGCTKIQWRKSRFTKRTLFFSFWCFLKMNHVILLWSLRGECDVRSRLVGGGGSGWNAKREAVSLQVAQPPQLASVWRHWVESPRQYYAYRKVGQSSSPIVSFLNCVFLWFSSWFFTFLIFSEYVHSISPKKVKLIGKLFRKTGQGDDVTLELFLNHVPIDLNCNLHDCARI